MNAYLQRADDFIQQQIYKYEQKLQGRDYVEMHSSPGHNQHGPPARAQTFHSAPPQGPPAPKGWSQEYDPQCQRWYYMELSTGRSQWDPPSFFQNRRGHRHTMSAHQTRRHNTNPNQYMPRRLQDSTVSSGNRSNSHMSHTQSAHMPVPQQHQQQHQQQHHHPLSMSPHPSPNHRLPPGTHLDMRTGQVMTNMFPPDHTMNTQAQ